MNHFADAHAETKYASLSGRGKARTLRPPSRSSNSARIGTQLGSLCRRGRREDCEFLKDLPVIHFADAHAETKYASLSGRGKARTLRPPSRSSNSARIGTQLGSLCRRGRREDCEFFKDLPVNRTTLPIPTPGGSRPQTTRRRLLSRKRQKGPLPRDGSRPETTRRRLFSKGRQKGPLPRVSFRPETTRRRLFSKWRQKDPLPRAGSRPETTRRRLFSKERQRAPLPRIGSRPEMTRQRLLFEKAPGGPPLEDRFPPGNDETAPIF